jgi:ubiquinone/menaquinone biosynthesis C-methylase UbiE
MEEAKAYYDRKSKSYDATFDMLYFKVYDAITWKYLEPYIPTDPGALVLDAGGGTGRWAVRMAGKGCRVVLMDASEGMLRIARIRTKQENLQAKITIKRGSIARTGYPDRAFDLILCEHTMFLFKEPDTLVRELARILKKGARLIISAHNRYATSLARISDNPSSENIETALKLLLGEKHQYMTEDGKIETFTWTPNEFRDMLESNDFCVEKIVGKGVTMPLRISKELFTKRKYPKDLFNKILEFELALCEKPDALALAGHMQAIARKL